MVTGFFSVAAPRLWNDLPESITPISKESKDSLILRCF